MGEGIGLWLDPTTGQVLISQSLYVALECVLWIGAVIGGLITGKLVLP